MRISGVISVSAVLALSACAELGFADLPLAELPPDQTGPVRVADLETVPAASGARPVIVASAQPSTPVRAPVVLTPRPTPTVPAPAPEITTASVDPETAAVDVTPEIEVTPEVEVTPEPEIEVAAAAPSPGPADAKPGQCFAEVTTAAVTRESTEQVLVAAATTKTETVPATYKTVTERELVSAATSKTEVVPATFKTITRRVPIEGTGGGEQEFETVTEQELVKEAETRTVEVEAVFDTVTERVKVKDATQEWRPGGKVYAIGAEALGGTVLANRVTSSGVMTLVEIPAEFENVTKRVLVTPATTREETVEAEYREVTRRVPVEGTGSEEVQYREVEVRVVDTPASVKTVAVPAEYKTVTRRVVDTPAVVRTVPVPAVYKDEVKEEIVRPGRSERVEVICEGNAIPDFVRSLQRALTARDFYSGDIDGLIGPQTREAIKAYQGTETDVLTVESARKLGLAL